MADSDKRIVSLSSIRGRDVGPAAATSRAGNARPAADAATPARPATDDPIVALAHYHLATQAAALFGGAQPRDERVAVETVHQMRVATRRLRAALRTFDDLLPPQSRSTLKSELKWLASVLSHVRDIDVYRGNIDRYAAGLPAADLDALDCFRAYLRRERDDAEVDAESAIRGNRAANLRVLLNAFVRLVAAEPPTPDAAAPIDAAAQGLIDAAVERVLGRGTQLGADAADNELHALRIECKHLRYTLELLIELYPKRLKRVLRGARALHDVLGDHQDACVASSYLRQYAETVPAGVAGRTELLALGQLLERQQTAAADARERFDVAWTQLLGDLRKSRHKLH